MSAGWGNDVAYYGGWWVGFGFAMCLVLGAEALAAVGLFLFWRFA